jgi:tetratricopeptide (TPR) repeat protein
MSLIDVEERLFGFGSGDWFERVRAAESGPDLGLLGKYRLIGEVGRGGQGVVFRALQPGTGRTIAVKRLLAGSFAAPDDLRRFQREAEAAASLTHPGIVTIHGVEFVDGSPLLVMEWVDGVRVTTWALGRQRSEVLSVFLQVCEAVQHAHQNGVLHRDLKPANVLVDAEGRPRLLDFGLAKRPDHEASSLTETGRFLGTPAYAAPEQWRGELPDARADIYALGTILFELLTGRRALEGEGPEAFARAAAAEPPRPSSVDRRIPRDLDAITTQAMASEPARRYQSVDALAEDVRRFQAGRPVLAHGPGALYLLRKLVARNLLVTAAVVALIGATLVYGVLTVRQKRRLSDERDLAVAAGLREGEARALAEGRQHEAEQARLEAQEAQKTAEEILTFLVEDVIKETSPEGTLRRMPTMLEVLEIASQRAHERFGDKPAVEARVHQNLGISLLTLGAYAEVEREMRRAIELYRVAGDAAGGDVDTVIAYCEGTLARALSDTGQFDEARSLLASAVERLDALPVTDEVQTALRECLYSQVGLALDTGRFQDGVEPADRLVETTTDEVQRHVYRIDRNSLTMMMGRNQEALREYEALLPETIALMGESSITLANQLQCMSMCYRRLGMYSEAVEPARRAVEMFEAASEPNHPKVASALQKLGNALAMNNQFDEAQVVAERGIAILRTSSGKGMDLPELLSCLGAVHRRRGWDTGAPEHYAKAVTALEEALALYESTHGRAFLDWEHCARALHECLVGARRYEDADALLEDIAPDLKPHCKGWLLGRRAMSHERRGEDDEAYMLYEQALEALDGVSGERPALIETLERFAAMLKRLEDPEGVAQIQQKLAELAKQK